MLGYEIGGKELWRKRIEIYKEKREGMRVRNGRKCKEFELLWGNKDIDMRKNWGGEIEDLWKAMREEVEGL